MLNRNIKSKSILSRYFSSFYSDFFEFSSTLPYAGHLSWLLQEDKEILTTKAIRRIKIIFFMLTDIF